MAQPPKPPPSENSLPPPGPERTKVLFAAGLAIAQAWKEKAEKVVSITERTAAGEQILVPGVAAVSDRQRAELAGSKPLQGGDAPPGGMFDDDARNQAVLFRGRGARQPANLPPNQVQAGRPVADQGTTGGKIARLEDLGRQLVAAFETVGREGRVTPGASGQFNTRSGVIRVRSVADFDTIAHETGHAWHWIR